jgi:hypothetical protein
MEGIVRLRKNLFHKKAISESIHRIQFPEAKSPREIAITILFDKLFLMRLNLKMFYISDRGFRERLMIINRKQRELEKNNQLLVVENLMHKKCNHTVCAFLYDCMYMCVSDVLS